MIFIKDTQKDKPKDTQSYMYQLTINAPLDKGYSHERIIDIIRNNFKTASYFCMADEEGSMRHTHIFIVFSSRVRFSMIKRHFPEAHIEKCKGTVSDNVNYIKKTGKWELDEEKQEKKIEGTFEEYGTQPPDSKGKRADMSELYQMIMNNMTNAEILAQNQDYILQIEKIDKVRATILTDKYNNESREDLEVVYISGATGTGKTSGVFKQHGYPNVYRVTDYQHPFDGYNCQPVICFDEFRSSLTLKDMLLYCDRHPVELPSRYSNRVACYQKIYIISNWELERQYSDLQRNDKESWKAFLRRIHKVVTYDSSGNICRYNSVDEYFKRNSGFVKVTDDDELPFE